MIREMKYWVESRPYAEMLDSVSGNRELLAQCLYNQIKDGNILDAVEEYILYKYYKEER